MEVIKFTTS